MAKKDEIQKLRSDIEAVSIHLQEHFNLTKCGAEEALDLLRERAQALEAGEEEPDMTPGPEDVGRWVMVRDFAEKDEEVGPYILCNVDRNSEFPFRTVRDVYKYARIIPAPIRGVLKEHDGSGKKPEWLGDGDLLLVDYGYINPVTARPDMVNWLTVRRYQKLEVK